MDKLGGVQLYRRPVIPPDQRCPRLPNVCLILAASSSRIGAMRFHCTAATRARGEVIESGNPVIGDLERKRLFPVAGAAGKDEWR